jgi:hypothetical protein
MAKLKKKTVRGGTRKRRVLSDVERKEARRIIIKGEFALILAVAGHAVNNQTLEQLADVAVGDA